jgi:hypothetical protein
MGKGCGFTKSGDKIKKFQVSVSMKTGMQMFYIKYRGKWQRIKFVFDKLKKDGLASRRQNIIKALKTNEHNYQPRFCITVEGSKIKQANKFKAIVKKDETTKM